MRIKTDMRAMPESMSFHLGERVEGVKGVDEVESWGLV